MAKFVFTYRSPAGYTPGGDETMGAWQAWFQTLGDHVDSIGNPVFERTTLGDVGAGTELGGFSFIDADDLATAAALATGCPMLVAGGGVEVGAVAELPG